MENIQSKVILAMRVCVCERGAWETLHLLQLHDAPQLGGENEDTTLEVCNINT